MTTTTTLNLTNPDGLELTIDGDAVRLVRPSGCKDGVTGRCEWNLRVVRRTVSQGESCTGRDGTETLIVRGESTSQREALFVRESGRIIIHPTYVALYTTDGSAALGNCYARFDR